MKKSLCALMIALVVFSVILVQNVCAEEKEEGLAYEMSTRFWNKYLTKSGFVLQDEPGFETEASLSYQGFYVGIWWQTSAASNDLSSHESNEVDWTIGYEHEFDLPYLGAMTFDIGLAYFDIAPLFKESRMDFIQPYAEIGKEFSCGELHALTPYIRLEQPLSLGGQDSGAYIYAGLRHDWQLSTWLSVNHEAYIVHDDGAYGDERGIVGGYQIDLPIKITDQWSLVPALKITTPLSGVHDRQTEMVAGAGVMLTGQF